MANTKTERPAPASQAGAGERKDWVAVLLTPRIFALLCGAVALLAAGGLWLAFGQGGASAGGGTAGGAASVVAPAPAPAGAGTAPAADPYGATPGVAPAPGALVPDGGAAVVPAPAPAAPPAQAGPSVPSGELPPSHGMSGGAGGGASATIVPGVETPGVPGAPPSPAFAGAAGGAAGAAGGPAMIGGPAPGDTVDSGLVTPPRGFPTGPGSR